MLRGMNLTGLEKEKSGEHVNSCPLCGLNGGNGCICDTHWERIKDFNWVKDYINKLDKVDEKTIYIIDSALNDRKSYIINDVPVEKGRLRIEEYIEKHKNMSITMERKLKEILLLEKAKIIIVKMINEYESNNGNNGVV